uniref:Avl9 domain-containing protein n=1 Tax=Macrostomum lignano TaxID=282301 RepID=A0A1I8JDG7_9PLAT
MASPSGEDAGFILHILTIGFHHKHGSQLEFCFPALAPGQRPDSGYLPDEWKNLPGLALPDGAHNYEEDNVYFVLPSLIKKERSVFCVSCYRQIDSSQQLVAKTDDVTRSSVQKAVVVVSKVPIFGAIRERLSQAAQSYFEMRDFSRIDVLQETFSDLRRSFSKGSVMGQMYMGLSVKDLLLRYRQKLLVMFFMNPASDLTNTLVTLVSMFPNILEDGLDRCASIINSKYNVKNLAGTDFVSVEKDADSDASVDDCSDLLGQQQQQSQGGQGQRQQQPGQGEQAAGAEDSQADEANAMAGAAGGAGAKLQEALSGASSLFSSVKTNFLAKVGPQAGGPGAGEMPTDDLQSPFITDDYGFPLPLFAESALFLPYTALQQIDILDDPNVRACLIGANNSVFKDNRQKVDALIGSDQGDFTLQERALAKQLKLTGADEVFMQLLINKIIPSGNDGAAHGDAAADSTGVSAAAVPPMPSGGDSEGSDDWLRSQFRMYLLSALLAAKSGESEDWQDFNASFIRALQKTYHFKVWSAHDHRGLASMENPQHPCHGQSAIGMKFNQLLTGTEQGRKVTNAVQSTGRVIEDTGKAFGGAIFNARSAMSGFFTGLQSKAASRFSGGEAVPGAEEAGQAGGEADAVDLK